MTRGPALRTVDAMTGSDLAIDTLDYDLSFVPDEGISPGQVDSGERHPPGSPRVSRPTGPDVSDHNRNINWDKVREAGNEFAIAKASEGLTWRAATFPGRWKAIADAGLLRGAYHFARPQPGRTGADEAKWFLRVVDDAGGFRPGDLRPVLNLEWGTLDAAGLLRFSYDFAVTVKQHSGLGVGVLCMIYTGFFWRENMGNPSNNLGCHLWLAAHVSDPERYVPLAWKQKGWSMWQFTSTGSCPGIPGRCDLNVIRDRATLAKLRLPSQR